MATFQVFGIDVPQDLNGLELNIVQRHYYRRNIVRASSALNLLQMQHQAGLRMLAASDNEELRQKYLPLALSGELCLGIAYAHLRNSVNNPTVRGVKCAQGYSVNGAIRFVTGHGIFQKLVLGFVNEQNEEMIALLPFPKKNSRNNTFVVSAPMDLPACKSTRTIWITLNNLIVPCRSIISIKPKYTTYNTSLTRHNFESLHAGMCLAILDLVLQSPRIHEKLIENFYHQLIFELNQYEVDIMNRQADIPVAPIRAQGILLMNRCLLFAQQVFRGAGVNKKHPLFRLHNETQLLAAIGADDNLLQALIMNINNIVL